MNASRTLRLAGALALALSATACISLSFGGKTSSIDLDENEIQVEAGEVQLDEGECAVSCCSHED